MIEFQINSYNVRLNVIEPSSRISDFDYDDYGNRYISSYINELIFEDLITGVQVAKIGFSDDTSSSIARGFELLCDNIGVDNNGLTPRYQLLTTGPIYCGFSDKIGLISMNRGKLDDNIYVSAIKTFPSYGEKYFMFYLTQRECEYLYYILEHKFELI